MNRLPRYTEIEKCRARSWLNALEYKLMPRAGQAYIRQLTLDDPPSRLRIPGWYGLFVFDGHGQSRLVYSDSMLDAVQTYLRKNCRRYGIVTSLEE